LPTALSVGIRQQPAERGESAHQGLTGRSGLGLLEGAAGRVGGLVRCRPGGPNHSVLPHRDAGQGSDGAATMGSGGGPGDVPVIAACRRAGARAGRAHGRDRSHGGGACGGCGRVGGGFGRRARRGRGRKSRVIRGRGRKSRGRRDRGRKSRGRRDRGPRSRGRKSRGALPVREGAVGPAAGGTDAEGGGSGPGGRRGDRCARGGPGRYGHPRGGNGQAAWDGRLRTEHR
jgi:hypothetical protein